MLIFRSKKCVRTLTSNYVKLELLINQSSVAILKWDLALETTTRVTTQDNTTQHEYNTSATRTTRVQHEITRVQYNTARVQHEKTQDNTGTVRYNTSTTRPNTSTKEARQQR